MSEKVQGSSILETPYAKSLINKIQTYKKEEGKDVFDLFTSMEDVEIFLKHIEPAYPKEVVDALKLRLGVADQEGESVEVEGIGQIDISIASLVKRLNEEGFTTLASCSGLLKEHPKQTERMSGYLSFLNEGDEDLTVIKDTCDKLEIPWEYSKAYFKPSLTLRFRGETDKEIESKWKKFESKLFNKEGS